MKKEVKISIEVDDEVIFRGKRLNWKQLDSAMRQVRAKCQ